MRSVDRWVLWIAGTVGEYERRTLALQLGITREYVYAAHKRLIEAELMKETLPPPMPHWKEFETIGEWQDACDKIRHRGRRVLASGRYTKSVQCELTEAGKTKFREEFPGHEPR